MADFDSVQSSLMSLKAMTDASEAHGTLCGLLIGQQEFSRWLEFTLDTLPDAGDILAKEEIKKLHDLFEYSRDQLNADDMSLELLLPDEQQEFAERLIALASWCQGFLYGLAVNGDSLTSNLSEQARECLDDLLQISQLSHDEEQSEEAETNFAEIVEHVRLSVIYMNEEINPPMAAPSLQ